LSGSATHAEVVPGTAKIFSFENGSITPGGSENLVAGKDLAVTDDFIFAEPVVDLTAPCVESDSILCIDQTHGDARFRVAINFSTTQGGGSSGVGHAVPLSSVGFTSGGAFWFFSADNPEGLIKILNTCAINNKFWIFYSAGTTVGFTVSVIDTHTGHLWTSTNPDGRAAPPVTDTSVALDCP